MNKEGDESVQATQIDWSNLTCDRCTNLAGHVCVDEADLTIRVAYCEDCYWVNVGGTVWLHYQSVD